MDHRSLTIDEVLTWASAIASQLSALHTNGQGHGSVATRNVRIEGNSAHLAPALGLTSGSQSQDIVQLAALLRKMLESVQVETEAARAQWRALDRIATTNSHAGSDSRMKKVASALKLLRSLHQVDDSPLAESPAGEPKREATSGRRGVRILMLVREVVPDTAVNPKRVFANTIHVGAFLASAASIALVGCLMFLRFAR